MHTHRHKWTQCKASILVIPKALHERFLKSTNVCKNSFHSNWLLCTSLRMRLVDCVNSCSNRLLATPLPSEKLRPHPPATLVELKNPLRKAAPPPTRSPNRLPAPTPKPFWEKLRTQPLLSLDPQFVNLQGLHQTTCLTKTAKPSDVTYLAHCILQWLSNTMTNCSVFRWNNSDRWKQRSQRES